ncbi:hypothetical protein P3T43_004018 [Paraburkholderia sp. GAS41]|jgi:hypothetical protein|uniref:hypothetical protein n=1 Tax=Paraburkholderia sp. GAS41 TaxID=3035134 RepID=UPI003D1B4E4E
MRSLLASTFATILVAASPVALAQASSSSAAPRQSCDTGYVTGVGGSAQAIREYLALPDRDKVRYVVDHPIKCDVSDEGRASACTGITSLQHEQASVYDDSDSVTTTVTARVELDHGTYPVIIVVPKQDLQCAQ